MWRPANPWLDCAWGGMEHEEVSRCGLRCLLADRSCTCCGNCGEWGRTGFSRPKEVSPKGRIQIRVIALRVLVSSVLHLALYVSLLLLEIPQSGLRLSDLLYLAAVGGFVLILALNIPQNMRFDSEGFSIEPTIGRRELLPILINRIGQALWESIEGNLEKGGSPIPGACVLS
jgi:hypothetical protein